MNTDTTNLVENRNEIVALMDAMDCLPNGTPTGENRPRIDRHTGTCGITDVCFKQYLRQQLESDGHDIFVRKPSDNPDREAKTRWELALDILAEIDDYEDIENPEDFDEDDADTITALEDVSTKFFDAAVDARYFGATFAFKANSDKLIEALSDVFPSRQQGPVQFLPSHSLNEVQLNDEMGNLTSVIATDGDNDQGGYDLDDYRIKFGLFPFYALVDEENGQDVNLTEEDVRRLDTLCWRAVKNQTNSRAKLGQEPRLYVRVEYEKDHFHIGNLHRTLSIDRERSKPDEQMRDIYDVTVDVSDFLAELAAVEDYIKQIRVIGSRQLDLSDGDTVIGTAADLPTILDEALDTHVDAIDVYDEAPETV